MIVHIKDGGVIRTVWATSEFVCGVCLSSWTEKADVWQDCAAFADVPRTQTAVDVKDVEAVKALTPLYDPRLPRKGIYVERHQEFEPLGESVVESTR